MLTVNALDKEIKRNKIYPVYLFMGEEGEDKRKLIEQIIESLKKRSNNVDKYTFFGDELEVSDILSELQTFSFFDNDKVVIIKNIEKINLNKAFFEYLNNPNEKSILILLTDKNDFSPKLQKAVNKVGRVVKFWKNFQNEVERWLISEFKTRNIQTDIEVVRYIIEVTGNRKEDILNQINVISNYLEEGETLNLDKLKRIISRITRYSVFDLINSAFVEDPIKLIKIFYTLLEDNENIVNINYLFWRYLKTLIIARSYKEMGYTDSQLISTLKLRKLESLRIKKIITYVSIDSLKRLINNLEIIDHSAKTKPKLISIIQFEKFLLSLEPIK